MIPPGALTDSDFEGTRLKRGTAAVVFVADWCGFCRRFLRDRAGEMESFPVPFLVADASDDDASPLWDAFGFHVVPTLALFRDGELVWKKNGVLGLGVTKRDLDALRTRAEAIARGEPVSQ